MRPPRRWIIAGIVAAGVAAVLLLLFFPRAAEVRVIAVARADAVRALAVNGRIRPRLSVEVRSPVAGTLIELRQDVGDQVTAGTLLARIDDGPQRAAIAEADAAVAAQEAVVAQARRDYARYRALGEFVARQRLEEARLAVERGMRDLQRLRAARSESSEVRERTVIRAPFTGIILERPVDRGQTVGLDTILYRLADLAAPEIMAEVDEAYAAELRSGSEAVVALAGQNRRLRARVVHIEPRVDEATGAREVRLRFIDPLSSAPAGETVSVNLVIERRSGAISIPRSAILDAAGNPRVRFVNRDGRVGERAIRFIDWPAADVIVTQGLEPDMRLLADPNAAERGESVRIED